MSWARSLGSALSLLLPAMAWHTIQRRKFIIPPSCKVSWALCPSLAKWQNSCPDSFRLLSFHAHIKGPKLIFCLLSLRPTIILIRLAANSARSRTKAKFSSSVCPVDLKKSLSLYRKSISCGNFAFPVQWMKKNDRARARGRHATQLCQRKKRFAIDTLICALGAVWFTRRAPCYLLPAQTPPRRAHKMHTQCKHHVSLLLLLLAWRVSTRGPIIVTHNTTWNGQWKRLTLSISLKVKYLQHGKVHLRGAKSINWHQTQGDRQ